MPRQGNWIAVLEDDDSTRLALSRILEANKWTALGFRTGDELLAVLEDAVPACAILDICLPPPNGFEVYALIRERVPLLSVIFITAYEDPVIDARARACSNAILLRKPIGEAQLFAAIASLTSSLVYPGI
jgi:two-component system response regulator FixJ